MGTGGNPPHVEVLWLFTDAQEARGWAHSNMRLGGPTSVKADEGQLVIGNHYIFFGRLSLSTSPATFSMCRNEANQQDREHNHVDEAAWPMLWAMRDIMNCSVC